MVYIKFKQATWNDVYTSSQRSSLIYKVLTYLEDIIESPERSNIIKEIQIEKLDDIKDKLNNGYRLAIGSKGLLEAKMISYDEDGKVMFTDSYRDVKKDEYVEMIEKYSLDYQKLFAVKNKIKMRIVG